MPSSPSTGPSVYTPGWLNRYDLLVHRISCPLVWGCPSHDLVDQYRHNVARRHLDVGPGTGTLLLRAGLAPHTQIHLLDKHLHPLEMASHALAAHAPLKHTQDALKPWALDNETFRSVGMSLVVHALDGDDVRDKVLPVEEAHRVLEPGGRFFGSTIMSRGDQVRPWPQARALMGFYNSRGIFNNRGDDADAWTDLLRSRFARVHVRVRGCVVLWEATK
ncbi:class I SAM-dependent methyltransferase [Nocardiopsis sp. NPDC049922]|uniref:class I SAM-dependent methyltransferase n=1 Tax=Nocardiopsis sp. NPDC049922 TaxID=3155157 RepID=UPI003405EBDB